MLRNAGLEIRSAGSCRENLVRNIESDELKAFGKLASVMLVYDEALAVAVGEGALMEVICYEEAT